MSYIASKNAPAKPRRATSRPRALASSGSSRRVEGSVLDELGLSSQRALELKVKAALHQGIMALLRQRRYSSRELEKLFDVPQPRISELTRGKLSTLSVGKLLWYADRLKATVSVRVRGRAA